MCYFVVNNAISRPDKLRIGPAKCLVYLGWAVAKYCGLQPYWISPVVQRLGPMGRQDRNPEWVTEALSEHFSVFHTFLDVFTQLTYSIHTYYILLHWAITLLDTVFGLNPSHFLNYHPALGSGLSKIIECCIYFNIKILCKPQGDQGMRFQQVTAWGSIWRMWQK